MSGYLFLTGAAEENRAVEQSSLSVPATIEEPETARTPAKPSNENGTTPPVTAPASGEAELVEDLPAAAETTTVLPVSGSVVQDYAMDRLAYNATTQDWRVHNGVDLAAELGQPVKAARAGTVTAVYDDEYLGTTVVIQHDGGYTSHYCNLAAEPAVSAGETVETGAVIGTIGGTALLETADEPHLHFEVYLDGAPTDPAGFLY